VPPEGELRHELTLGQARTSPPAAGGIPAASPRSEDAADDLAELALRCRRKAEDARIAADHEGQRAGHRGSSGTPSVSDEARSAWTTKLIDGFRWASASSDSPSVDVTPLEDLAGCFETVAEALVLVGTARRRSRGLERSLELLAEAQSALRASLRLAGMAEDDDQLEVYEWLRTESARHRVYLKRFMRADALADPSRWKGLLDRIEESASAGRRGDDSGRTRRRTRSLSDPPAAAS